MSLESLAPDQRAVVQLVLQQERSYDDLAGLLGISTEAVRERARAGLERVGGSAGDLTEEERGEIADYLLGQQSVSRREATRSLLGSSADARRWANRVSDALDPIARSPLPGVPGGDEDDASADFSSTTAAPAPEPVTAPAIDLPDDDEDEDDEPTLTAREDDTTEAAPVRARPRPRPRDDAAKPATASTTGAGADRPRSSRIGGALLIAGIAVMLAVVVVFILRGGGDDDNKSDAANEATATPTATAEATPAVAGQVPLTPPGGGNARGLMTLLVSPDGKIQFSVAGENIPQSRKGEAYAVWLTGGPKPIRLGFTPVVGEDGRLGVGGPREGGEEEFLRDFGRAKRVVISRETTQDATEPGPAILRGAIPRKKNDG